MLNEYNRRYITILHLPQVILFGILIFNLYPIQTSCFTVLYLPQVFISSQNGTVRISAPVAKEELEDDKQRIEG